MKRLFAAIKIQPEEGLISNYWSLRNSLKDEKIRWVDPDNIHITLKFFGETPEHHIPGIAIALRESTKGISPFQISLSDTGIFGSSYKPRVIWFGVESHERLKLLFDHIVRELINIGIENDRQNFVPHLTIGRIKHLDDKKHFQKVIDHHKEVYIQKEEVSEFHLFQSILKPDGPEYRILESYCFK